MTKAIKRPGFQKGNKLAKGRPKGSPNKATADIKELAREYTEDALRELARLATKAESEAARVAAIKELLDRGYGKSHQSVTAEVNGSIIVQLKQYAPLDPE